MISSYAFSLLLAGLTWQAATAAPLYKWVDSAGQVTYSSLPPPAGTRAERVQPAPQPSAEAIRQAEERLRKMVELARELEDERRQQEAQATEEARLRALQAPPAAVVIEQPVYLPQPFYYYPPMTKPPRRHHDKPPPRSPRPDRRPRANRSGTVD